MGILDNDGIRGKVRENYGKVAKAGGTGCGCSTLRSCCGTGKEKAADDISLKLGYSQEDVASVPEGANMGLGCGNPQAIAALKEGETVLDLGSGGGFDCFLAAKAVGEKGRVIGVDMTPEMVSAARRNIDRAGVRNVEIRLGEIESLPVADGSVDVIISNCVINLSPEKERVFREASRVLKAGGRLAVSDIVALREMPEDMRRDVELYAGCVAGASLVTDIESMVKAAGFVDVRITRKEGFREYVRSLAPGRGVEEYIASAAIEARKPE